MTSEQQILGDRLHQIDERLAQIKIELANRPVDGSYQRQELLSERSELTILGRVTERKLRDLTRPITAPDARRERFVAAEVAHRREHTIDFINKLEKAGEHRQARIWRRELLNIRAQVEREFPV
jgi:hypothetical protein